MLLLLEHPPVLTLGRNAHREHILAGESCSRGAAYRLFETNRGGDVTYHGPGQLVGYPILDLRGFTPPLGIVEYVRKLEEVLIRACADYGMLTQRIARPYRRLDHAREARFAEKKIAAIGVHISRGVTSHGFALNVTTDLDDFELIVPCGIPTAGSPAWKRRSTRIHADAHSRADGQLGRPALWPGLWRATVLWVEDVSRICCSGRAHGRRLRDCSRIRSLGSTIAKGSPCRRK